MLGSVAQRYLIHSVNQDDFNVGIMNSAGLIVEQDLHGSTQ